MEVGGDGFDCEDADAGWETTVESAVQVGCGDVCVQGKAGNLTESVDAGIGAAGALGQDALAYGAMNGIGEQTLDGGQIGLNLPAMVRGSIVCEGELPVRHGDAYLPQPASWLGTSYARYHERTGRRFKVRGSRLVYWAFSELRLANGTLRGTIQHWRA